MTVFCAVWITSVGFSGGTDFLVTFDVRCSELTTTTGIAYFDMDQTADEINADVRQAVRDAVIAASGPSVPDANIRVWGELVPGN